MDRNTLISLIAGGSGTILAQCITIDPLDIVLTVLSVVSVIVSIIASVIKLIKDAKADGKVTADEMVHIAQETHKAIEQATETLKENKNDKQ